MEQSTTVTELAKALVKMQGELKTVPRTKVNPFHKSKYADLSAIWEVCRKPLADNDLSLVQTMDVDGENIVLETTLLHTSGEWMRGRLLLYPAKMDPQGIGSAITYGRRYAMSAMLGIASDDDDDAEAAMDRRNDRKVIASVTPAVKKGHYPEAIAGGRTGTQAGQEWLKRSLQELNWNPLNWIEDSFGIHADRVSEVLTLMNDEQKNAFTGEVKARLSRQSSQTAG